MKIVSIPKKDFTDGLAKLQDDHRVFAPVKEGRFHNFRELKNGQVPDFDFLNTRLSPKELIYPQSQVMFQYTLDESDPDHHVMKEPAVDETPRVVVGIRPCDVKAFLLVQRNFDTPDHKDPYWIKAFESTTFIGYACSAPCRSCFCTTAGSGPYDEQGLDVLLVDDGGQDYLAEILTPEGQALADAAGWQTDADADAAAKIDRLKNEAEEKVTSAVSTDRLADLETLDVYDADFWEDVSFSCINCGTCTYVCPTCWCFDIQDENRGKKGIRLRNWDSCMFPLFSLHGSGHNPRDQKLQRVRQRFMHKLKYYVDKYGDGIQCVGCGRCVRLCPVNIDIRRVCELMNNYGRPAVACEV